MAITVTFDPPLPSDSPSTFNTKAFTLLGDLNDWSTEANALASTVNSNASTSATNASNASNSADAAATSASNTAAIYDAFDDRYLGAKAVAPTLDNDGGALLTGALYFNTASNTMFVYTGSSWVATNASFAAPGPIGGTTPASGTFTTLTSTGNAALGDAEASDTHAIKGATTLLANSASAALTVTQTGAGNAFVVEDSASTDSTPFVIDANGAVIIGDTATSTFPAGDGSAQVVRLQAKGSTFAASTIGMAFYNNASTGSGASLSLAKSNTNTIGGHAVVVDNEGLGAVFFSGSDGTSFIRGAQIVAQVDGTPGTNDMPGRLIFSTTADGASSPTERMRIDSSGAVGIGTALTQVNLYNTRNISGNGTSYGNYTQATVQSDVTTAAMGYRVALSTQDTAFTLGAIYGFYASQGTITGGSRTPVTNQYGFVVDSTLTGATNNYGFYSNIASAANRYNLYCAGTADNYMAGSLGVGGIPVAGYKLLNYGNYTGSTTFYGTATQGTVQSDVTTAAVGYRSAVNTAAASFTLSSLFHFIAEQGTIGTGGNVVTNQYGFNASVGLTGATNNYGFTSNIPAGTNRWNIYAAGTADNYFAGAVGIGGAPYAGVNLLLNKSITGSATNSDQCGSAATILSDVTGRAGGFSTYLSTQAASFTLANLRHYSAAQNTIGAGSTITNQFGFYADATLTGATNNFGFYSNIASAANRYNFYAAGTAANAFSGDVKIFGAGALGYSTGSGGTITQATSRTTGVTLNKTNGQITLFSAAGSATAASFTVTNSTVAATDTIVLAVASGTNKYMVFVTAVAAGSFEITFQTTGGTSTDAPVINFAVIKAVSA